MYVNDMLEGVMNMSSLYLDANLQAIIVSSYIFTSLVLIPIPL